MSWRLKSVTTPLFVQEPGQVNKKIALKLGITSPLWGIQQKGPLMLQAYPCDDVIIYPELYDIHVYTWEWHVYNVHEYNFTIKRARKPFFGLLSQYPVKT